MSFFSYIAGGFGNNIGTQIKEIYDETSVPGSAISVSNIIRLVEKNDVKPFLHEDIKKLFGINRQILMSDI